MDKRQDHKSAVGSAVGVTAASAVLIAYVSLLPFELDTTRVTSLSELLSAPTWVSATGSRSRYGLSAGMQDVAANLALYLPLGGAAAWLTWRAARGRTRGFWLAPLVGLMLGAAWSYGIECVQAFYPDRVSSWWDVAMNATGALAGAVLAVVGRGVWRRLVFEGLVRRRVLGVRARDRRSAVMGLIVGVLLAVGLVAGYSVWAGPETRSAAAVPLAVVMDEPYDVAAVVLARSLGVWVVVGAVLLVVAGVVGQRTQRWGGRSAVTTLLAAACLGAGAGWLRGPEGGIEGGGFTADNLAWAEPTLAVAAVVGLLWLIGTAMRTAGCGSAAGNAGR